MFDKVAEQLLAAESTVKVEGAFIVLLILAVISLEVWARVQASAWRKQQEAQTAALIGELTAARAQNQKDKDAFIDFLRDQARIVGRAKVMAQDVADSKSGTAPKS